MKKLLKWIGIIFVALLVIGLFAGKDDKASANAVTSAQAESASAPAEPPVSATSGELLKAYKENEVAANLKYKGKPILLSGKVSDIQAGFNDKPYLIMAAGGEYEFNRPQAHIVEGQEGKAAALKKGQSIKLLCVGNSEVAGTPMLKDCSIQ